jgi:hypothetical protein
MFPCASSFTRWEVISVPFEMILLHSTQSNPSQFSSVLSLQLSSPGTTSPAHIPYPAPSSVHACVPALQIPFPFVPSAPE